MQDELQESKNILEQAKTLGVTGSGVDALSGVINSETLAGGDKPVVVPEIPTSTTAEGLSGFTSSIGEQGKEQAKIQAEQDAKVAEVQAGATEEKGKLQSLMDKILGVQGERATLEKEAKIGEKAERLTATTNQLEALERAEVNELRALQGSGLTDVQRAARGREISRRYAFEKADVALLQSAANRDLETAQNIINRKIELTLEPLLTQLDFTKLFYQENKADLNKAEDRAFNLKIKELDRQYEETKSLETYKAGLITTAIQNGVNIPSYVLNELNKAGSQQEVAQVLARNGISLQDPLNVALKRGAITKQQAEIDALKGVGFRGGSIVTASGDVADTTPFITAFNNAVLGLPMASQKIATATFKNLMASGDLDGTRNYLIRMSTQGLPAADQTQALGRAQATASMKEINSLLEQAKSLGSPTNLLTGSLVNISGKLGASTNTDLAYIGARIQQQLQVYRRSMTGVAFSPQESAEYAKIFPDITNVESLNQAKIKALTDAFDSNNRASLSFLLGGDQVYEQIFGEAQTPLLPSQARQATQGIMQQNLSVDEAYQLYLEEVNQPKSQQEEPRGFQSSFLDFSGYEDPFSGFNLFGQ